MLLDMIATPMQAVRSATFLASIACLAASLPNGASAQTNCLTTGTLTELLSDLGVPVSLPAVLVKALQVESTAESSVDQVTQLSPAFANKSATELTKEDQDLDKAQQFVRTMPTTQDTLDSIKNMQKMRDNIKSELNQRNKKNIPPDSSPKQLQIFEKQQEDQAKGQAYTPNPMGPGGPPSPHAGPGNGPDSGGTVPSGGATCSGNTCSGTF
jgi:hypothetical protein